MALLDSPGEARAQVVCVQFHCGQPRFLIDPVEGSMPTMAQFGEVVGVPRAESICIVGCHQALTRVQRKRLQQPVTDFAARMIGDDQRLVDQMPQQIGDVLARDVVATADGLGGLERASASEHRQPSEDALLIVEQQVIAPLDDGPEGLLPWQRGPRTACQEAEAIVQPGCQLVYGDGAHAAGGQLDRQRHAVQSMAQLGDGLRVLADGKATCGRGPIGEQRNGVIDRHRRHRPDRLAAHPEGLAAGRNDRETGARHQQSFARSVQLRG